MVSFSSNTPLPIRVAQLVYFIATDVSAVSNLSDTSFCFHSSISSAFFLLNAEF